MRLTRSQLLKLAGVAGAVGVAATGALVVRNERERRAYTPDEVREQLHARYSQATAAQPPIETAAQPPGPQSSQDATESDDKRRGLSEWGQRLLGPVQRLVRRDR